MLAIVLSRGKVWTWLGLATVCFSVSVALHRGPHSSSLQEDHMVKRGSIFVVFLYFLRGMDFTLSSALHLWSCGIATLSELCLEMMIL